MFVAHPGNLSSSPLELRRSGMWWGYPWNMPLLWSSNRGENGCSLFYKHVAPLELTLCANEKKISENQCHQRHQCSILFSIFPFLRLLFFKTKVYIFFSWHLLSPCARLFPVTPHYIRNYRARAYVPGLLRGFRLFVIHLSQRTRDFWTGWTRYTGFFYDVLSCLSCSSCLKSFFPSVIVL